MPVLWLIDDTPHWHAVTAATVATVPTWQFTGFHTALAGLMAYRQALAHGVPPAVILCDFYLDGSWRGDALCGELRQLEIAVSAPRCTIVGHSTSPAGSAAIVAAGGDVIVAKHGQARNRSLQEFLDGLSF